MSVPVSPPETKSLAPSPSLDWHVFPFKATPDSLTRAMLFWKRGLLNECDNSNSHHCMLHTKNSSFPHLQCHPGLDITPDFVLGDRNLHASQNELLSPRIQWLLREKTAAACPALKHVGNSSFILAAGEPAPRSVPPAAISEDFSVLHEPASLVHRPGAGEIGGRASALVSLVPPFVSVGDTFVSVSQMGADPGCHPCWGGF